MSLKELTDTELIDQVIIDPFIQGFIDAIMKEKLDAEIAGIDLEEYDHGYLSADGHLISVNEEDCD